MLRHRPGSGHRLRVVARVFDHRGTQRAQAFFLPDLGIVRHVYIHLQPQRTRHHPHAVTQIAGAG